MSYYINSVSGRVWIASVVSQQVGQANVNGSKLRSLVIPLPPLAEQTRIVAEVERNLTIINKLETQLSINFNRATRFRQSMLQNILTKKLNQNE